MEMPKVIDCSMRNCAYNRDSRCHAAAITVGGPYPLCDTSIVDATENGGDDSVTAGVGACRVEHCVYNQALECTAQGIHVGKHSHHAECDTFAPR